MLELDRYSFLRHKDQLESEGFIRDRYKVKSSEQLFTFLFNVRHGASNQPTYGG